ncbi:MAG: ADP-glyceromanno-heptose 6-epimerase [Puniceicoccaceae bacterium]|nr:MAG: ADP-glyceromanno-heptose 6-epimerase [Puniceicoccaceae bacterium]
MKHLAKGKLLVTGGAGFIGSAVVWGLNRLGLDDIVVADFLGSDDKWRNLVPLRFADYLEADDLLRRLQERPDGFGKFAAVFHLGACSSTTERDAAHLIRNNYETTKTLAHWAVGQNSRFIYASSAATYGDGTRGMEDGSAPIHRLAPLNMYGYSKHLFDLYARRTGLEQRIMGLKYFNVFGPNENHKGEMRSLVSKAFDQINESGSVSLFRSQHPDYKDGEQQRDFLYVKDAVAMTLHLSKPTIEGGLYNLGSGNASTWLDLAHALFAALGKEPRIEFIDMPAALQGRYQYHTCADTRRLRDSGFSVKGTPLVDAVADYVRNYLAPDRRLGHRVCGEIPPPGLP